MVRTFVVGIILMCAPIQAMEASASCSAGSLGCVASIKIGAVSLAGAGAIASGAYYAVQLPACTNGYNGWNPVYCDTSGTDTECGDSQVGNQTVVSCIRPDVPVGWTGQRILQATIGPMITSLAFFTALLPKTICDPIRPTEEYVKKAALIMSLQSTFACYAFFCDDSVSAIAHGVSVLAHVAAFIVLRHRTLASVTEPVQIVPVVAITGKVFP